MQALAGDAPLVCLVAQYQGFAAAAAATGGQHTAAQDAGLPVAGTGAGSAYRPVVTGSVLKRHGRDLTQEAAEGRLDPLIGRHDVLERTLQVLLRRTKNNPVLIGDPGVGKTAVAEGLAQLIASPSAPPGLAGRALISLDVGSLVAGTQYRGAFEERLTSLLNEVRMAAGRVLLFIDELHILMDAGRVEGGMNAANLLKPALARGELHCIGATTVEEYRRHIEQDGAFARRFQPIMVEEPTLDEALGWLLGLRGRYERHHGVRFTDGALEAAVTAAQRCIPERRLPDSAIDVIDEAAARTRLRAAAAARAAASAAPARDAAAAAGGAPGSSSLQSGSLLDGRLDGSEQARRLNEWLQATQQGPAQGAAQASLPAEAQLAGLGASATHALSCPHCGTPAVPREGSVTVTCSKCRSVFLAIPQEKLLLGASLFAQSQQQQQAYVQQTPLPARFPAAASALVQSAGEVAQQAAAGAAGAALAAASAAGAALAAADRAGAALEAAGAAAGTAAPAAGPPVVGAAEVLAVVAEASGIPAEHLSQTDWHPLAQLEARLRQRVAGQDAAVAAAVGAVRLGRLGMQGGQRPLASLLLTGPAGVGKATLCHALASTLFGSDRHLLRFNLAEYSDRASVSRLVGAPPGYVGYGDGGLLTEAVRRRPHSLVLLERIDRAHPEVLSLVIQVLESGQLQDSMGKRCDFKNAIIVLTTSPTAAPLPGGPPGVPPGGEHQPQQAQQPLGGGSAGQQEATTVLRPEAHVHPEAYASDSNSTAGSGTHSAHGAAAQCLQVEERPPAARRPAHPLRHLPAELLSRLDAVVGMQQLSGADMERVVDLQLAEMQGMLQQQGIVLQVDAAARAWLAERGRSPVSGARRLQALLREQLLLPIADAVLQRRLEEQQARGAVPGAGPDAASEGGLAVAAVRLAPEGTRLEIVVQ
ncbi:hypothetical protein ABPG77_000618 [Micractinium sp. CCAP 211/92]